MALFYSRICDPGESWQKVDRESKIQRLTSRYESPAIARRGGMRGFFTLEILHRVETLLRERYKNPKLVLVDYFNFIGGTSTEAIIGGLLSWGRSIEGIKELYERFGTAAFQSSNWWGSVRTKYRGDPTASGAGQNSRFELAKYHLYGICSFKSRVVLYL
jgi:hypothetical protein